MWREVIALAGTVIASLGGFEFIKWLANRRANSRKANAEAGASEFSVLRDTTVFLQEQLRDKEVRFAEQTELVRKLNRDIAERDARLIEAAKKHGELELKEQKFHCEVRGCANRQPPNGY